MLLGTLCRGGRLNVARVSSVFGSNMYSCGPAIPTHTEMTRPWWSNVIDPQSCWMLLDSTCGERPSGPPQLETSVCQPSSWISDSPFGAMNGLRGVGGTPRIGCGVAGLPMNAGGGGTATEVIGVGWAPARPARASVAAVTAPKLAAPPPFRRTAHPPRPFASFPAKELTRSDPRA